MGDAVHIGPACRSFDGDWVNCETCEKWRKLPANVFNALEENVKWSCEMNSYTGFNKCSIPQECSDKSIDAQRREATKKAERAAARAAADDGILPSLNPTTPHGSHKGAAKTPAASGAAGKQTTATPKTTPAAAAKKAAVTPKAHAQATPSSTAAPAETSAAADAPVDGLVGTSSKAATGSQLKVFSSARRKLSESSSTLPATTHTSDPSAQPSVPATAPALSAPKPSIQASSKLSTNSTTQRKPRKSTEQASLPDAQPTKPAANVALPHTAASLPETSILDSEHPSNQTDKCELKAAPQATTGAVDQDPAQPPLKKKKTATHTTQQPSLSGPASGTATPPAPVKGEASAGASGPSVTLASEDTLSAALSAVLDAAAGPSATPQWEMLISSLAESLLSTSNQAKMAPVIHTGKLDGIDFKIVPKKADTDASLVCQGRFGHGQFWCLVDGVAHGVSRPVDVCKLYSTRLLASDNLVNRIELVRYRKRLGLLVTAVGERLTGKEGHGASTVGGGEEEGPEAEAGTGADAPEVISLDDDEVAPPVQATEGTANPAATSTVPVTAAATTSDAAAPPVPAASKKSVNQKTTSKPSITTATPKQPLATPPTAKPRPVGSRSSGRHTSGTSADLADTPKGLLEQPVTALSTDAPPVVQGPEDSTATLEAVETAATTSPEVGAAALTFESGEAVLVAAPRGATSMEASDAQPLATAEATRVTEAAAGTVVSAAPETAAAVATPPPPLPSPSPVPQATAILTSIMAPAVDTSAPTAHQTANSHASAALDPVMSSAAGCVIDTSTSTPEASADMLVESAGHVAGLTGGSVAAAAETFATATAETAAATEESVEAATATIPGPAEAAATAMETDEPTDVAGASKQAAAKKGGGGRWPKAADGTSQAAMNKAHAGLKNPTGPKPAGTLKSSISVGEVLTAVVTDVLAADIQPEASAGSGQFDDMPTPLLTELPKLSQQLTQLPSSHVPKPLAAKGRAPKQHLQPPVELDSQPQPSPPQQPTSHAGKPTSQPASLSALPLLPLSLPLPAPTSTQRATQKRKPNTPHPAAPPATAACPNPSSKAAPSPSSATLQHPLAPPTQQTAQLSIINAASAELQPLQQTQPAMAAVGAPERRCYLELGKAVVQGLVLVTITDLFTCLRPPLPDVVALHLLSGQALRPELLHVTTANAVVVADVQRMLAYVSGTGIPVEEWGVSRQLRRGTSLNGAPASLAAVHEGAVVAAEDEQGQQPKRRRVEGGGYEVGAKAADPLLATNPPSPADDALMLSGIAAYILTGWAEIRNEPGSNATTAVPLSLPAPEPVPVTTEAVLSLAEAADPVQPQDDHSLSVASIAISGVVNEAGAAAEASDLQQQAPQPVAAKLQTLKQLSSAVTSLASSDTQANSAAETMSRTLLEFGITSEDVTVLCERLVDARKAKQSSVARLPAL